LGVFPHNFAVMALKIHARLLYVRQMPPRHGTCYTTGVK
jgi:hypothetical protein